MHYKHSNIWVNNRQVEVSDIINESAVPSTDEEGALFTAICSILSQPKTLALTTSGTTGTPKQVEFTFEQLYASALRTITTLGIKEGSNTLITLPVKFTGGFMILFRALVFQHKVYYLDPSITPKLDSSIKINFASFTPIQVSNLLDNQPQILEDIDVILIGGAPVNEELANRIKPLQNRIFETYGMSETASHIALKEITNTTDSSFHALDGVNISQDGDGNLIIRDEMTNTSPINTHDKVELTGDKSFRWLSRTDQVFNSGGVKISVQEVTHKIEAAAQEHNLDLKFRLIIREDSKFGQHLEIQVSDKDVTLDSLGVRVFPKLHKFEIPKSISYINSTDLINNS